MVVVVVLDVATVVVVVVVVGHGTDCGLQTSVIRSTSVRAAVAPERTAVRIVHCPGRLPFTRVRTLIGVTVPHTASAPFVATWRRPTGPQ